MDKSDTANPNVDNATTRAEIVAVRDSTAAAVSVDSNFQSLFRGNGPATKPPFFDNNPHKFQNWLNQLHHYLLVLDVYGYLNKENITDQQNKDLYKAVASCLVDTSLNLVATQAFGDGLKAYKLICQKFLGNSDAREAATMIEITDVSQHDDETLSKYIDRFETLKNRLDEFGTIAKSQFYVVLCLRGLHTKFAIFKNILSTGKTPEWDAFKEKIESHSGMMSLDNQKCNKILSVSKTYTPNIVKRGGRNFKKFIDHNSRKCLNCFRTNHSTKNCNSMKFCNNCKNASHNTYECRLKHKFTYQAEHGTSNLPGTSRGGYTSHRGQVQHRGRGNRPHFVATRGSRGRPPMQKHNRINFITQDYENTDNFDTEPMNFENEYNPPIMEYEHEYPSQ